MTNTVCHVTLVFSLVGSSLVYWSLARCVREVDTRLVRIDRTWCVRSFPILLIGSSNMLSPNCFILQIRTLFGENWLHFINKPWIFGFLWSFSTLTAKFWPTPFTNDTLENSGSTMGSFLLGWFLLSDTSNKSTTELFRDEGLLSITILSKESSRKLFEELGADLPSATVELLNNPEKEKSNTSSSAASADSELWNLCFHLLDVFFSD